MAKKKSNLNSSPAPRIYWGADVPMEVIRRFARQVAERFQPEKIILFGSHAYGTPTADSDVDILVIMQARNKHSQACKIRGAIPAPFPMDLLVRTPEEMCWRLTEGDLFHTEILSKGKILYEKSNPRVGKESRGRFSRRQKSRATNTSST